MCMCVCDLCACVSVLLQLQLRNCFSTKKESKKALLPCMCHGLPLTCMDTTEFMLRGYNVIFQKKKKKKKDRSNSLHHTDSPSGIDLVHYLCNCYSSSVIKCSKPALFAVSSAIACLHLRPTCMTSNSASVGRHIKSIITKDRCVFNNVFVLLCVSVYIFSSCWFADSHNLLNARTE